MAESAIGGAHALSASRPTLSRLKGLLREESDRLFAHARALTDDGLAKSSGASKWSVAQVLSHLGSGAEIGMLDLSNTGVAQRSHQQIWALWDARSPRAQLDAFLDSHNKYVSALDRLDEEARVVVPYFPTLLSAREYLSFRLNELTQHGWDVRIAADPDATLADDVAKSLVEAFAGPLSFMVPILGQAKEGLNGNVGFPHQGVLLSLGAALAVQSTSSALAAKADTVMTISDDGLVRLFGGRFKGAGDPGTVRVSGLMSLEDIRSVFEHD